MYLRYVFLKFLDIWFKKTVITRDIPVPDAEIGEVERVPYLSRHYLWRGKDGAALFFHRILLSDPGPEVHNHPWRLSVALILAGGYWEERLAGRVVTIDGPGAPVTKMRWMGPGSINVIRDTDYHRLIIPDDKEAWTLFFHTGKRVQKWGFLYPSGVFEMASEEAAVDGVLNPKAGGAD